MLTRLKSGSALSRVSISNGFQPMEIKKTEDVVLPGLGAAQHSFSAV